MKTRILRKLMLIAVLLTGSHAFAHEFEASNSDGVTIYYNILSETDKTVVVTFKGSEGMEYDDEYIGSVIIPENVIYNGSIYSVTSIGYMAFINCDGLTSITIPNTVTAINTMSFAACQGLTSITIPKSITYISYSAFSPCLNLTSIIVESGNTKYDSRDNCNAIIETSTNKLILGCKNTVIPLSVTSIGEGAFGNCKSLTSITIPNSVTSIGESAFRNCGLTSVTIPNSVASIGNYVFSDCTGLTSVTIPNSVTSIGEGAFENCKGLTSVTIPNSVTSIGISAFFGCSGLTSVTIPNSVTSIGNYAFNYCTGLTSVTIPNTVTSIGSYAFSGCSGLTSVTIPNSVTSIGMNAFSGCSSLSSIEIPNSVTGIGNYAFKNCSMLTEIICKSATPPTAEEYTFHNVPTTATLYVPVGSKDAYASAEFWNVFTNIEEMESTEETTITIMDATNQGAVSFSYDNGKAFEFTVSSVTGYIVNTVLVNGEICETENGTYMIESVSGKTTISVSYEIDPETGVNTLSTNNIKVYGYDNTLTVIGVEFGDTINVYDLNGTMVHTQSSAGSTNNIALISSGIYIVKVNNKSFKVIL